MNAVTRIVAILTTLLLLGSASIGHGADTHAESIVDFVKLKSKWNDLVGAKFRLEGRVSGNTETILGLYGCSLEFRSTEKLPKLDPKKEQVEVSGELARDERTGTVYFKISSLKRLEQDDRVFERRRLTLPRENSGPWYELADWAVDRGTHYKDNDLVQKGRRLQYEALLLERSLVKMPTVEIFKELRRKAALVAGTELFERQLQFEEGYLWVSEAMTNRKTTADELYGLAMNFSRQFRGCDESLKPEDLALREPFMTSPVAFYEAQLSSKELSKEQIDAKILKLHRIVYSGMLLESFKRRLAKDGSNGKTIAADLERLLPEYAETAKTYRDAELQGRIASFEKLSLAELNALRKELVELGRAETSNDLLLRWFAKREEVLRKRGSEGLTELAVLYHTGYDGPRDKRRVIVALLFEAEKERAINNDGRTLFELYGYREYEGKWMTDEQIKAIENSPIAQAIRDGRVIEGMTPQQVQKAVGKPSAITKSIASKQVNEYWIYRDARFSVKLSRSTSRSEATVAAVEQLPQ